MGKEDRKRKRKDEQTAKKRAKKAGESDNPKVQEQEVMDERERGGKEEEGVNLSSSSSEEEDDPREADVELVGEGDMAEVEVEFGLSDISESDYHAIKQALAQYLGGRPWHGAELANFLVAEKNIGTALRAADQCFGFVSMVRLHSPRTKKLVSLKEVQDHVLQLVNASKHKRAHLQAIFEASGKGAKGVGLMLNERLVNIPESLAWPIQDNLFEEIHYAVEHNTDGDGAYFDVDYYLYITTAVSRIGGAPPGEAPVPGGKKAVKSESRTELTEIKPQSALEYGKVEDEIFQNCAELVHVAPAQKGQQRWSLVGAVKEYQVVMLIAKDQVPRALERLKALTGEVKDEAAE